MPNSLIRTTRSRRCPICKKPDWCSVSSNGDYAICMRVRDGCHKVTSNRGYLHFTNGSRPKKMELVELPKKSKPPSRDWSALEHIYYAGLQALPGRLDQLSSKGGLGGAEPLGLLRAGWISNARAYSFPMRDASGRTVGIHLRYLDGSKLCMKGSSLAMFVPGNFPDLAPDRLYICEGASDTAVILDRGLRAIGRPSNVGGLGMIVDYCKSQKNEEIVLVCDRDKPGTHAAECTERGRRELVSSLKAARCARTIKSIRPPGHNDVKEWGPTRETIEAVTCSARVIR